MMAIPRPNPAPRVKVFTAFVAIIVSVVHVPFVVAAACFRRAIQTSEISFKSDLIRSLARNSTRGIPLNVQRKINRPKDLERVLGSNRFRHLRGNEICKDVLTEDFAGYWICQGSLESKQSPSKSDVVIFWIHGGGYVLGHPLQPLAAMLHIAQGMEAHHNLSVSIFALEYTLAPEAALPTQQNQALSAYTYLIKDLFIDPSKIVVLGESAGGHLALTLLCGIAERNIPKPQGACLICPWVNLANTGASFARNAHKDILRKPFLDWCADVVMPSSLRQQDSKYDHLLNFAVPSPNGRRWAAVLPPSTWVSVGLHDMFLDDIRSFVRYAAAEGAKIVLETGAKMPHGWPMMLDVLAEKDYLSIPRGEDVTGVMKGAEIILKALVDVRLNHS